MRAFLDELDNTGDLRHVRREVSTRYEIAAVAHKLDAKPILFDHIKESKGYRVGIGVCGSRALLAMSIGVGPDQRARNGSWTP